MKVFLSPWICNPRMFEVRIYNPHHHFGSQTLILRNGGLQIHRDGGPHLTTHLMGRDNDV